MMSRSLVADLSDGKIEFARSTRYMGEAVAVEIYQS